MSIQHMQMVFDAGGLASGEKSILLAYCNFTDAHGYCWPGVERIADMTGFSDRGVKKIRKNLIERGLLATSSRVNAQGVRTTNITRVNLERLAVMRMPEKVYKDNVVHELEFKDDTAPDQPKGTEGTPDEQPKCTEFPDPVNTVPRKDGAHSSPYPSGDPSNEPSSSSAEVEDITDAVVVPEQTKKTKTTPEQIIIDKLSSAEARPQGGPPTPDEAATIKRRVISQAAADGVRIRSIEGYLSGRDVVLLEQDLAAVRGTQTTVDGSAGGWSWEDQLRAERRARNGVKGGARAPVPDHTYWQSVTDEDLKNLL